MNWTDIKYYAIQNTLYSILSLYDKMPKNIELAETEKTKNAIKKDYANIIKKVQMYENNKCNNCGALFSFVDKRFLFKTFKVCSKCGKKK